MFLLPVKNVKKYDNILRYLTKNPLMTSCRRIPHRTGNACLACGRAPSSLRMKGVDTEETEPQPGREYPERVSCVVRREIPESRISANLRAEETARFRCCLCGGVESAAPRPGFALSQGGYTWSLNGCIRQSQGMVVMAAACT
jgi:hypothetical protein